jgi:benzoyl-CoA reductase/2-hydroxyglutaryl-CoA dehydratase subunit BcrC/BadD/HgdB
MNTSDLEPLRKLALQRRDSPIKEGTVVVGSYVPREIIEGLGIQCIRLLAKGTQTEESYGTRKLGHEVCSWCKAMLSAPNFGAGSFFVGATTCDQFRRFIEAKGRHDNTSPITINIPSTRNPNSQTRYTSEIRWLADELAQIFGKVIDTEKIREVCIKRNNIRKKMNEIHKNVSSQAFLLLNQIEYLMDADEMLDLLDNLEISNYTPKKVRLMHCGSPMTIEESDFLDMIESYNAEIIYDASSTGNRNCEVQIETEGDIIENIAKAYFNATPAIWMRPNNGFYDKMIQIIKEKNVQGIIWRSMRFCDVWNLEAQRAKAFLGLPLLQLDMNYSDIGSGRIATRVEAFVETLR